MRRWCVRISMRLGLGVSRRRTSRPSGWRRLRCRRSSGEKGASSNDKDPAESSSTTSDPDREALGRSRGGLSTKIHVLSDMACRPVARVTTAGQRHDSLAFDPLMRRLAIARGGRGRARTRPDRLLADKAYSTADIRAHLRKRRIAATIPEKADQIKARTKRGGRPPKFDPERYRDRNTVERSFNKLRAFRAVAMRTDKRDFVYRGTIDVASIKIWLRPPPK